LQTLKCKRFLLMHTYPYITTHTVVSFLFFYYYLIILCIIIPLCCIMVALKNKWYTNQTLPKTINFYIFPLWFWQDEKAVKILLSYFIILTYKNMPPSTLIFRWLAYRPVILCCIRMQDFVTQKTGLSTLWVCFDRNP